MCSEAESEASGFRYTLVRSSSVGVSYNCTGKTRFDIRLDVIDREMDVTFKKTELIYTSSECKVKVSKGIMMPGNVPVAIKEEMHDDLKSVNRALNEAIIQSKLSGLHTVCDILNLRLDWKSPSYTSTIVLAWMEQDLSREIMRRKRQATPWTSEELLPKLFSLIQTFDYMQTRGIAHRDIKPQNLFFASDGALKLGDFGSSKQSVFADASKTIAGTPAYLSPELKRAFRKFLMSGEYDVPYNPFKADVYALGVTFLQMALLDLPKVLVNGELTPEVVNQLLIGVEGEILKWIIGRMIDPDQETRPDFITLWTEVNSIYQSQGAVAPTADWALPSNPEEGHQQEAAEHDQEDRSGYSVQASPDMSHAYESPVSQPVPEHSLEQSSEKSLDDAVQEQKDCYQCGGKFTESEIKLPLPTDLQSYEEAVPQLCSIPCFQAYRRAVEGDSHLLKSCMQCSGMFHINKTHPVMLPCDADHGFHDLNCFIDFLVHQTEMFKKPLRLSCLKCGKGIEETFVYTVLGGKPAYQSLASSYLSRCVSCTTSEGVALSCSHVICNRCLSGKSRMDCQVCPKCGKETPYECENCGTLKTTKLDCAHYVCLACSRKQSFTIYCDFCQKFRSPVKHV